MTKKKYKRYSPEFKRHALKKAAIGLNLPKRSANEADVRTLYVGVKLKN